MSLERLAKHVQAHGRGEDTMLIHMTPKEVAGLQALAVHHGGSLTINPHTGLPEAGFLSTILPIVAGAALAPFTGGLSAALMVGAGAGLYSGIKSGNAGKGLLNGLTAGLGAFGGAGLGAGLAKMGGAAAAEGVGVAGSQAARSAASAVPNTAFPTGQSFLPAASQASGTAQQVAQQALTPANFGDNMMAMGRGIPASIQNPGGFVDAMGGGMSTGLNAGMAAAPMMLNQQQGVNIPRQAPSNLATLSPGFMQAPMYSGTPNVPRGFAEGGLTSGPGDGMSDHIPAALSPDEFVIPADVVSHLGNGSSQAGSQRLYEMLDRVRAARTGNAQQAPQINPNGMVPA